MSTEPTNGLRIRNNLQLLLAVSRAGTDAGAPRRLGISRKRFRSLLDNTEQPTFEETWLLARWLGVNVHDIYSVRKAQAPVMP